LLTAMNFKQAFNIEENEVISLVGGGGKTTLMFAIAGELSSNGSPVITTTTTKIASYEPSRYHSPRLIVEQDEDTAVSLVQDCLKKHRQVTLVSEEIPGVNKFKGIKPETVDRLAKLNIATIIVEADGASRKPLKAPNDTEPVIPESTTLLIPVTGIDALNRPLTAGNVFRAEIAAELLGVPIGEKMTAVLIARLLTHARGITRGTPEQARIMPFINKLDMQEGLAFGRILAKEIIKQGSPRIRQVVLGRAKTTRPVVEVIRNIE
jgi:probable selenium-dependent hydroxylase accessory protein YqeC